MSRTLLEPPTPRAKQIRKTRIAIIGVMLVSLVASALTRDWARAARDNANRGNSPINTSGKSTIANMNSYTLALLLGGLRGPLVLILWTSSESQKVDKNLEDFDTKVELIRLLQPEFDSVLIFQIWNKAYNISVQMSSLFNKYTTILDAIDYGQAALQNNPDNINVLEAIGDVYFNKLGGAAEKIYYRTQVRKESLPHKLHQRLDKSDPGWRRIEMDQLVDANGYILPEKLRPLRQRPADLPAGEPFNDGSELQYLAAFQPFKYGVSPMALGYNYYKKAQMLQRVTHLRHAQLSEHIVDGRPSIALKFWAEEEQEIGRRNEQRAFNIVLPNAVDRTELELPTAGLGLNEKPVALDDVNEAIYDYDRSALLTGFAREEYQQHLKLFPNQIFTYQSHLDGLVATEHFGKADAAYLHAILTTGPERAKWVKIAKDEYAQTIFHYERIMMKYYTDEGVFRAFFPTVKREQIDTLKPDALHVASLRIQEAIAKGAQESHGEDRGEYLIDIQRCSLRLKTLEETH